MSTDPVANKPDSAHSEPFQLNTPVVFIVFNRPDTTARVFEEISRAKPPKLLVIADGPRPEVAGEAELCSLTRSIATTVDWPCELSTNFSATNMGCRSRVTSGLDWAFGCVDEAIILEDDCLPDPSFFQFCQELLERYRLDDRIAHIGGTNFQNGESRTSNSYYFSRHSHVWGWATWRRAWTLNDVDMQAWVDLQDRRWLRDVLGNSAETRFWGDIFDRAADGKIDAWSYAWIFCVWRNNMLSVIPNINLISNIGFGPRATHTTEMGPLADMDRHSCRFPLIHPQEVERNRFADSYTDRRMFSRSVVHQLVRWLKLHLLPRLRR